MIDCFQLLLQCHYFAGTLHIKISGHVPYISNGIIMDFLHTGWLWNQHGWFYISDIQERKSGLVLVPQQSVWYCRRLQIPGASSLLSLSPLCVLWSSLWWKYPLASYLKRLELLSSWLSENCFPYFCVIWCLWLLIVVIKKINDPIKSNEVFYVPASISTSKANLLKRKYNS